MLFVLRFGFDFGFATDARIENLRSSIERLGGDQTHTLRGLDAYEKGIENAAKEEKLYAINQAV